MRVRDSDPPRQHIGVGNYRCPAGWQFECEYTVSSVLNPVPASPRSWFCPINFCRASITALYGFGYLYGPHSISLLFTIIRLVRDDLEMADGHDLCVM